ncbi:hypothetical protein CIPAW_08G148000 [Carya illinoinensis]|uniref:Uncharacterized protein n=1 Tax=Carya illinoinensis TaxID=32201 RepID=A0A8T1PMY1_CARIL|nr:hypothetical protein CIPAW_08G148000 [Carya illinoinensis]
MEPGNFSYNSVLSIRLFLMSIIVDPLGLAVRVLHHLLTSSNVYKSQTPSI